MMLNLFSQFLVALATAYISYFLSRKHTDKVAGRQRKLLKIDELTQKIEEVAKEGTLYHSSAINMDTKHKEIIIQHTISSISREINSLTSDPSVQINSLPIRDAMIKFRQKITGGDFATTSRSPIDIHSPLLSQIIDARDELISQLKELEC